MHPGILSCDSEATMTDVARMMSTHHVHCIAVEHAAADELDEPVVWGIISDLDLLRAGMRPDAPDTAADLEQRAVMTVESTAALRETAELMLAKGTSHVVVVNPQTRRPVGILSTLDVAGVLSRGEL